MTDDEYRLDLLAAAAARAEVQACGRREGLTGEILERLRDAGEVPDTEPCGESLTGQRGRRLEMDAWADDDADGSIHLFVAMLGSEGLEPVTLTLSEAREQGFGRLQGIFEQSRDGWLTANIEESRPLWALARRIQSGPLPSALRLHVISDRPASERIREIAAEVTREKIPITFQIWDLARLKRIHDAQSTRDDLVVDFTNLPQGGLPVLPASVGSGDYDGYLAVVPGEALADIYIRHGSRLLEGNVRTFLGRSGRVNRGIAATIAKAPARFFAYNNGIAATASQVAIDRRADGSMVMKSATDLQIVNGAQTTASLASSLRDRTLKPETVFVPMKLSVVAPAVAADLIPEISRFANSQNGVKASDFFANHAFHRRIEEISRRILAPAAAGMQIQSHWYYERARGQYLNDLAKLSPQERKRFEYMNPRRQVIAKTDLAKVELSFAEEPDTACKGAEKAFVSFAERIAKDWTDETKKAGYGDDWYREAVARVILFRTTEKVVSLASWYENGYRAQIVAYTCARLARLAKENNGSTLDFRRIWDRQEVGEPLERQIGIVGEEMARVLRSPPQAGQNITEWAKQQASRETALRTPVRATSDFGEWLLSADDRRAVRRGQQREGLVDGEIEALTQVMARGPAYWEALRSFWRDRDALPAEDARALTRVCRVPPQVPGDGQAARLLRLAGRARDAGWQEP